MFRGAVSPGLAALPRSERRLAVLAQRTHGRKSQRATYLNAERRLTLAQQRRQQDRTSKRSGVTSAASVAAAEAESVRVVQGEHVNEERAHHRTLRSADARNARESKRWADASQAVRSHTEANRHFAPGSRYSDNDEVSGESKVQMYFDSLVRDAVLRFGPPLPAEFVMDNSVVTQTTGAVHSRRTASAAWRDEGADGTLFHMYDEVGLRTSELLTAIRRLQPNFSFRTHCDGIPFALLIKNCSYLRAFNGKVNAMRYLKREPDGRIAVSLAKYKMREAAPQDGIRQGPQPWLYGGRM